MPPVRIVIEVDDKQTPRLRTTRDSLTDIGKAATDASGRLRDASGRLSNMGDAAQKSSTGLSSLNVGIGNIAKGAAGFALVTAGVGSLGDVITSAGKAVVGFDSAMGKVNTLIAGNIPLQQQLKDEILKLPPALGTSAELAEGLYAALSAGIEPAKAVQFVAESARAAQAGLADMGTTTDIVAKLMQNFSVDVANVSRVSDTLFQTVNVGAGSFEQFASGFATVGPLAAQLGLSLEETGATLATLSFAFQSPAEAATGFRGLLSNLVTHMNEFKAVGIDVGKTISEGGMAGLMRKLAEATGGESQAIQQLIPDIQGFQSAIALTGKQAGLLTDSINKMGGKEGSALAAFQERAKTVEAQWKTFTQGLDRLANEVSPPFLKAATEIIAKMTEMSEQARAGATFNLDWKTTGTPPGLDYWEKLKLLLGSLATATNDIRVQSGLMGEAIMTAGGRVQTFGTQVEAALPGTLERAQQALSTATQKTQEFLAAGGGAGAALGVFVTTLREGFSAAAQHGASQIDALKTSVNTLPTALPSAATSVEELGLSLDDLGFRSAETIRKLEEFRQKAVALDAAKAADEAKKIAAAFDEIAQRSKGAIIAVDATGRSFSNVQKPVADMTEGFHKLGQAAEEGARGVVTLRDGVLTIVGAASKATMSAKELEEETKKLGITLKSELAAQAQAGLKTMNELLTSGKASIKDMADAWPELRDKAIRAYGSLPPEFAAVEARLKAQSKLTASAIGEGYKASFAIIGNSAVNAAGETIRSFEGMEMDINGRLVPKMEAGMIDMYGRMTAAGEAHAAAIRRAFDAAANAAVAGATAAAAQVENTFVPLLERIGKFAAINTPFATTVEGLSEQIQKTLASMRSLNEPGPWHLIPGYIEFQTKEYQKILQELYKRLADLQKAQSGGQPPTAGPRRLDVVPPGFLDTPLPPPGSRDIPGGIFGGGREHADDFRALREKLLEYVLSALITAPTITTPGVPRPGPTPPIVNPDPTPGAPMTPSGPIDFGPHLPLPESGTRSTFQQNNTFNIAGDTDPQRTAQKLLPFLREAHRRGELLSR